MLTNLYERYKDLVFWKRALFIFLLSGSYFAFDIFTKLENFELEKASQEERFFAERKKLNKVLLELKRLPSIKANLVKAEKEFQKSKERLPDDFHVEKLLETFSSLAKRNGLTLELYDPGIPGKEEGSYTYISLPIAIIVSGEFYHIVKFMENILNLDQLLEIRNYKMELLLATSEGNNEAGQNATESQKQNLARENSKIKLEASIYAFRSLSEKEFNSVNSKDLKKNKKKTRVKR